MLGKAFTVAAFAALAAVPAQATTFDFTGGSGHVVQSHDFSADGINLTVTAGYFDGSTVTEYMYTSAVGHYAAGLGVDYSSTDDSYVDGNGRNDLLIFTFDTDVELQQIEFSYWDYDFRCGGFGCYYAEGNDEFTLFSSDPWTNLGTNYNPSYGGPGGIAVYNFAAGWVTDKFGVGADDTDDEFKIRSLTVTAAIPEPATWLMMIMGFGLVGLAARRRTALAAA